MSKAKREKTTTTEREDQDFIDHIAWSLTANPQITSVRGDLNGLPVYIQMELGPDGHRPVCVARDYQMSNKVEDFPTVSSAYNLYDWPRKYIEARFKAEDQISKEAFEKRREAFDAETKVLEDAKAALPKYMTMPEVVEASRFSIDTVRKAIKEGRLIASQPEGREWRIFRQDFDAWMRPLGAHASEEISVQEA